MSGVMPSSTQIKHYYQHLRHSVRQHTLTKGQGAPRAAGERRILHGPELPQNRWNSSLPGLVIAGPDPVREKDSPTAA